MFTPAVSLIKAHAYGNDFLMAESEAVSAVTDLPEFARQVCDRHRGIGADGLMVVERRAAEVSMRLWNADGSRSELSGNGVRCVAAWVASQKASLAEADIAIETEAGLKRLRLLAHRGREWVFRAAMGKPDGLRLERIEAGGEIVEVVVLRVGNPQCVVLGPVNEERLARLGSALAVHPFFPHGTNVELAAVEAPDRVRILIWERGVGPTAASGTGACAAAVAAAAFGGAEREVDVVAPGGTQRVEWTEEGLWLTGAAELVARIDWFAAESATGRQS